MSATLPLAHIRVLDLTRARAGPTAVRQLADWGPMWSRSRRRPARMRARWCPAARHGFDFQNLHRNKRSMTLNLKADKGREIFLEMAKGKPMSWSRTTARA